MFRFQHLKSCVLFGEVTNTFVHALLGVCPSLVRLELYFLGKRTDVDDTMGEVRHAVHAVRHAVRTRCAVFWVVRLTLFP